MTNDKKTNDNTENYSSVRESSRKLKVDNLLPKSEVFGKELNFIGRRLI